MTSQHSSIPTGAATSPLRELAETSDDFTALVAHKRDQLATNEMVTDPRQRGRGLDTRLRSTATWAHRVLDSGIVGLTCTVLLVSAFAAEASRDNGRDMPASFLPAVPGGLLLAAAVAVIVLACWGTNRALRGLRYRLSWSAEWFATQNRQAHAEIVRAAQRDPEHFEPMRAALETMAPGLEQLLIDLTYAEDDARAARDYELVRGAANVAEHEARRQALADQLLDITAEALAAAQVAYRSFLRRHCDGAPPVGAAHVPSVRTAQTVQDQDALAAARAELVARASALY